MLLPQGADRTASWEPSRALTRRGEIAPLLSFVEARIFPVMSNRDYRWMDEYALKMAFTALLWSDVAYLLVSELEVGRGHADLCLLRRFDRRSLQLYDLVFEFKYAPLDELGMTGAELRDLNRDGLEELPAVRRRLDEAEAQLRRYRAALEERYDGLRLRLYAVASLGFERLVARRLTGETRE